MFSTEFKKQTSFQALAKASTEIANLKDDKTYTLEIKEKKAHRSLSANGYYWSLVEQLSKVLKMSKDELHELMLERYGTFLRFENGELFGMSTEKENDPLITGIHTRYRGKSTTNGKTFYHYYVIKGSRYYDTKEMSDLIGGIVDECKLQGIETMTPEEIARLRYE